MGLWPRTGRCLGEFMKDGVMLITGGTGSFGTTVLNKMVQSKLKEIRVFSRDEKKQDDLRRDFNSDKIKFYIGDVRDQRSINSAMRGVDFVYHAAALKQVPSCEFFPIEAVKTNVLGTENVLQAAIEHNVKKVVCLSTDKAVYPINAMGISKAMMEKVVVAKARSSGNTTITATRYGNVLGSRGSVLPLFISQILAGKPITITDPNMTRFAMTLDNAVDLVEFAFEHGESGDIFVQKAPAATIDTFAKATLRAMSAEGHPVHVIGTRHGEKLFESLLSREEVAQAEDLGAYFRIPPDMRSLNYSRYIDSGEAKISEAIEYSSHNTDRLSIDELEKIIRLLIEAGSLESA